MPEFFSSDGSFPLQFVVIFLVILVLLMGAVLLFRRLAGRGLSISARAGKTGRQPRLGIVDIYELDRHRQLILLRRDNVEHLLLVGGPNDVVVERNVQRGARLPSEGLQRPEFDPDRDAERPPLLHGPDADLTERAPEAPPSFEMPVVVPPSHPGSRGQAAIQAPSLDPRLFEGDESEAPAQPQPPARPRAVGRLLRRTPPPLVEPRPEPASERAPGMPPTMAAGDPRPVDAAVLSDMARQLEVALRRPASAVTPPPGQPLGPNEAAPPPDPEPNPPEPSPRAADPVAAGMAAAQVLSPAPPGVAAPPVAAEPPAIPKPSVPPRAPDPVPDVAPPKGAAPGPEPTSSVPPAPKAAAPPAEARDAPSQPAGEDEREPAAQPAPFSVEEIEAEFARLLGRPVDKKP